MHPTTSLTRIRRLMPSRRLTLSEALQIAERQANLLSSAWGGGSRAIKEADFQSLTPIKIIRDRLPGTGSGTSRYHAGAWFVLLQRDDSLARQRFTLAHELKHIIDAGSDVEHAYRGLTDRQIERVCDRFAACLLMNKRLVYRLWGKGIHRPEDLAEAAHVSLPAMLIRLEALGLPINSNRAGDSTCRDTRRSARVPGLQLPQLGKALA